MESERILVRRAGPLQGEVVVPGAKNSVLKLMAATLLADGDFTLTNVPGIADVGIMGELLEAIGVRSESPRPGTLHLSHRGDLVPVAPYDLVERIRASINVLGPLLGRCGRVSLSLPGGDDFGSRPIDMHLKGLEAMGATFELRHGVVEATAERLHGADITSMRRCAFSVTAANDAARSMSTRNSSPPMRATTSSGQASRTRCAISARMRSPSKPRMTDSAKPITPTLSDRPLRAA